jgi:hypothetical protein
MRRAVANGDYEAALPIRHWSYIQPKFGVGGVDQLRLYVVDPICESFPKIVRPVRNWILTKCTFRLLQYLATVCIVNRYIVSVLDRDAALGRAA